MNEKIRWLREKLKNLNMQGMIVSNPINVRYLTNIKAEGILLITRKENIYITDSRYIEAVNSVVTIEDEIIIMDSRNVSKEEYEEFFMFCERVGFEENYVTYSQFKTIMEKYKVNSLAETEGFLEKQRIIKDNQEIGKIEHACKITDDCFSHLLKFIKKGMTEKEVALEIEKFFALNGAEDISFKPIVASGANSSMPHAEPTDKVIEANEPIIIDMGCKYEGYCSDMTRTIFIDSVPEEIKPIYNLVLKNQVLTTKEVKENMNIRVITKMVENDFRLHNFDLIHSLGHGVRFRDS